MSYYDDSSLFVAPNGYKASVLFAQKPMDANGQLAFTRSNDTATRVASNGLIERVRTNLLVQSNTFSTTWFATSASVTSGQAGYDGTNNAWLLSKSAANGNIAQSPASSGSETISIYAKAGTDNWLHILVRDSALVFFGGYFDLQNGVVGSAVGATTLKIESVGNGWYRCSASFVKSTTNFYRIYPAEGNNDTSGTSGNILIQNAQLEAGDIATQFIPTTTAAVSVGPLANIPRIDYLGGGCGKLLLEPQRTNLITFSEQFNNAAWIKFNATISANVATSPDGYTNADKLIDNATLATHGADRTINITGVHTFSVFAKASESSVIALQVQQSSVTSNYALIYYDLISGQVESGDFSTSLSNGTIQEIGNGWYRCTITYTPITAGNHSVRFFLAKNIGGNKVDYVGNGTDGVFLYGAQLEAGSYASSYVPTLAASVTRGADACSKTGISSLIGQTEGTIFVDFQLNQAPSDINGRLLQLWATNDTTNAIIPIVNQSLQLQITTFGASAGTAIISAGPSTLLGLGRNKIAVAYTSTSVVVYRNGVLFASGNPTGFFPTSLTSLDLGGSSFAARNLGNPINQAMLFKTRIPNSELASLTTL